MKPALALILPLLLAACGSSDTASRAPAQPDTAETAACREEARATARTSDIAREANISNPTQMDRMREMVAEAENRAYRDCLRRRGVIRGGGVEPVRRQGAF